MLFVLRVAALCIGLAATSSAAAQDPSAKPVKIVVPFVAGGGVDVLARIVAQHLNTQRGRSFIVENRPGAGGNIGTAYVAKASPDGLTLLLGGVPQAISVSVYPKSRLSYDFLRDLVPLAAIASYPSLILVHPSMPTTSMKELIALARSRPGELTFGSAGVGSPNHLAIELLKTMTGTQMVHVPYSSGRVVIDLIAGHLHFASLGLPQAMPHVKAGKLRALAVTSAARSADLPKLPTVSETGLHGFEVSSWYGAFAPAATPKDIFGKLVGELAAVPQSAVVAMALRRLGAEPGNRSGEKFARYVRDEVAKWAKVVEDSGARVE